MPPRRNISSLIVRAMCARLPILTMFLGALSEPTMGSTLFGLFVISALFATIAFMVEMLLAGTGIREEIVYHRRWAE